MSGRLAAVSTSAASVDRASSAAATAAAARDGVRLPRGEAARRTRGGERQRLHLHARVRCAEHRARARGPPGAHVQDGRVAAPGGRARRRGRQPERHAQARGEGREDKLEGLVGEHCRRGRGDVLGHRRERRRAADATARRTCRLLRRTRFVRVGRVGRRRARYAFPASVTDVTEKSPPAHVAGFHTTTPPQPGTSNAAAVPAASSLSSRDSSASGHLSLGGTYATRCVGGASVSTGDVSTFHEDVSTKKGSSARGSTNARASSSHAARSLATREAACRSTWPSTFRVTQRASAAAARLAKRASTSRANRHEWLCPRRSGAASASVNESVAAPSGRVAGKAFLARRALRASLSALSSPAENSRDDSRRLKRAESETKTRASRF